MLVTLTIGKKNYQIDLHQAIDISIPLTGEQPFLNAWNAHVPSIAPHQSEGWIGSIAEGASVNFFDIQMNPHAHMTHTECVGHISPEKHSVNQCLDKYYFLTQLITVAPERIQGDMVISKKQIQYALGNKKREAVVIRTLPNFLDKKTKNYTNTNPPYLEAQAAEWLRESGIKHLLIDLPSVDKEEDGGALSAHKAFWHFPEKPRLDSTITEFVFVPNAVDDGVYLLNLQTAPIENDAAPSRPLLHPLLK